MLGQCGPDVNVQVICDILKATKPPYDCPIPNCGRVYKSYPGIQFHLQNHDHKTPSSSAPATPSTPRPTGAAASSSHNDATPGSLASSSKKSRRAAANAADSGNNKSRCRSPSSPVNPLGAAASTGATGATPARPLEALTYAQAQKIVEVEVDGETHRINITENLEIMTQDEIDNRVNEIKGDDAVPGTSGVASSAREAASPAHPSTPVNPSPKKTPKFSKKSKKGLFSSHKSIKSAQKRKGGGNNDAAPPDGDDGKAKLPEAVWRVIERPMAMPSVPDRQVSYYRYMEKTPEELDEQVEYDMDEEDDAWLEIINEKRKSEGTSAVKQEVFERLMDRLEKESYFQSKSSGKDVGPPIDEDAVCCICNDGECQNSNVILFCDMCNLAVHQECYGVPYIPEGQWLCRRCLQSPSRAVECVLCPNKGGAFKQTDDATWAHVVCALWIPEVGFANAVFLEPIDSVKNIPPARWRLKCYICKQTNVGACIQCHRNNCYTAFHVTCAQQAGLYLKMEPIKDESGRGTTFTVSKTAFCDSHTPADASPTRIPKLENGGVTAGDDTKPGCKINMKKARKILAEKRVAAPVVSVPVISQLRLNEIMAKVNLAKKAQFMERLIGYWTLKRQSRNGVPLLRRLQMSNQTKKDLDAEQKTQALKEQLKYWQRLRQDLEKARLLVELIRKRERLKRERVKIHQLIVELELQPLSYFLRNTLDQLREKDTQNIFAEPVNPAEAPDYYNCVPQPMDFATMRKKIDRNEYVNMSKFQADFNLIVTNCIGYNGKGNMFYRAAIKLRDQGGSILRQARRIYDRIGYDRETGLHLPADATKTDNKDAAAAVNDETAAFEDAHMDDIEDVEAFIQSLTASEVPLEKQLDILLNKMDQANCSSGAVSNKKLKELKKQIGVIRRRLTNQQNLSGGGSGGETPQKSANNSPSKPKSPQKTPTLPRRQSTRGLGIVLEDATPAKSTEDDDEDDDDEDEDDEAEDEGEEEDEDDEVGGKDGKGKDVKKGSLRKPTTAASAENLSDAETTVAEDGSVQGASSVSTTTTTTTTTTRKKCRKGKKLTTLKTNVKNPINSDDITTSPISPPTTPFDPSVNLFTAAAAGRLGAGVSGAPTATPPKPVGKSGAASSKNVINSPTEEEEDADSPVKKSICAASSSLLSPSAENSVDRDAEISPSNESLSNGVNRRSMVLFRNKKQQQQQLQLTPVAKSSTVSQPSSIKDGKNDANRETEGYDEDDDDDDDRNGSGKDKLNDVSSSSSKAINNPRRASTAKMRRARAQKLKQTKLNAFFKRRTDDDDDDDEEASHRVNGVLSEEDETPASTTMNGVAPFGLKNGLKTGARERAGDSGSGRNSGSRSNPPLSPDPSTLPRALVTLTPLTSAVTSSSSSNSNQGSGVSVAATATAATAVAARTSTLSSSSVSADRDAKSFSPCFVAGKKRPIDANAISAFDHPRNNPLISASTTTLMAGDRAMNTATAASSSVTASKFGPTPAKLLKFSASSSTLSSSGLTATTTNSSSFANSTNDKIQPDEQLLKKLQNESFKCYRRDAAVRSDSSDNEDGPQRRRYNDVDDDDDETDDATDSSGTESESATSENEDDDEEEEEEEDVEERSRMSSSRLASLPITSSIESSTKVHGANCIGGRGGPVVVDKAARRRKAESSPHLHQQRHPHHHLQQLQHSQQQHPPPPYHHLNAVGDVAAKNKRLTKKKGSGRKSSPSGFPSNAFNNDSALQQQQPQQHRRRSNNSPSRTSFDGGSAGLNHHHHPNYAPGLPALNLPPHNHPVPHIGLLSNNSSSNSQRRSGPSLHIGDFTGSHSGMETSSMGSRSGDSSCEDDDDEEGMEDEEEEEDEEGNASGADPVLGALEGSPNAGGGGVGGATRKALPRRASDSAANGNAGNRNSMLLPKAANVRRSRGGVGGGGGGGAGGGGGVWDDEDDVIPLEPLDLVWAKCRGYPWYPALIVNPKMPRAGVQLNGVHIPVPPKEVLQLQPSENHFYLVLFFDFKRTWQWLPRNKLEPLGVDSGLDHVKLNGERKQTVRKAVKKAYEKAIIHKCRVTGDRNAMAGVQNLIEEDLQ